MSSEERSHPSSVTRPGGREESPHRLDGEWKVMISVISVLVVCELCIGSLKNRLSLDLVHQAEIPSIMDTVSEAGESGVLFLGNSLIREGIDANVLQDARGATESRWVAGKVNPDDTSIVEWRYVFEQFARRAGTDGSTVVLGYAQNQLTDDSLVHPRRLGAAYFEPDNRVRILGEDVRDFGGRAEVVLSHVSSLFASARPIRDRVLASLIPEYRETAQRINRHASPAAGSSLTISGEDRSSTYHRLQSVLSLSRDRQIDLVIVAIPVGQTYELDSALIDDLNAQGVRHIDGRNVDGIELGDFPDGYHMNPSAARLFSAFLGLRMAEPATPQ